MERISKIDWQAISHQLDELGYGLTDPVLTPDECDALAHMFDEDGGFRSTVDMERHGFGRGRYRYFAYPLPAIVSSLRTALYRGLAPIANAWSERLGSSEIWPADHADLIARCHAFGQPRPTPLLLSYGPGDFNCLHQDLYGPIHFPLQAVIMLSPTQAFDGGSLALVENRPRLQSRAEVVPISQGAIAIIPVRDRPRMTSKGWARSQIRHGVSTVLRGRRQTLGIIFHDAS